ncbi:hypothetical protein FKN04_12695 [Bacillus glycinifermentans]|uniref:hypothetical protein n=1 Tax=Bacillus glycinifermentans TaxID=1664069 RepID=UPI001583AC08|nr:hypothetical protein [Bacillus glycinifermentans]NUJ17434.1 hypothetical protein [Bacillus glycinifermentans]
MQYDKIFLLWEDDNGEYKIYKHGMEHVLEPIVAILSKVPKEKRESLIEQIKLINNIGSV